MNKIPDDISKLANLLDSKFKGPFGFRFGIDGLLGLIPGLGDIVSSGLSIFILIRAIFLEVSFWVLVRMVLNVVFDYIIKFIPVLGLFFDFVFKSNTRNIELLRADIRNPEKVNSVSRIQIILFLSFIFVLFSFMLIGSFMLFLELVNLLFDFISNQ
ncbi:MAG: DUF4112 domain-containing protein [Bdellovibrionales bacterium]